MTNPNESTSPLQNLKRWMCGCCRMDASSDSKDVTQLASENKHATTSSVALFSPVRSESLINERKAKSGEGTSLEDEIERSKVHWSQLTEHNNDNKDVAEVSNVEVFKSLQMHPSWGDFFRTFGDGGMFDYGELVVGEKLAEGAQAELYHAHVIWKNPEANSHDKKQGLMWVLKVFRKGTFIQDLQKQWPEGMFQYYKERLEHHKLAGKSLPIKYTCDIKCGTLLPNGRFAFLMTRETEDLRTLITRMMKTKTGLNCGPFSMQMALLIMHQVAKGMDWLHNLNIIHRDLKASNVLHTHFKKNNGIKLHDFYVADFECSIGVIGTGFFRAPEILQALKDKTVNERLDLFTKASDVYSYGMVCYEVLTGKLPFEGHPTYDFDLVLKGQQLEVPHYVDKWIYDLLQRCWQFDSTSRPTFGEILKLLEVNSKFCERLRRDREEKEMLPMEAQLNLDPKYDYEF